MICDFGINFNEFSKLQLQPPAAAASFTALSGLCDLNHSVYTHLYTLVNAAREHSIFVCAEFAVRITDSLIF